MEEEAAELPIMAELLRLILTIMILQRAIFRSISSIELAGTDEAEEIEIMTDRHHIILKQNFH